MPREKYSDEITYLPKAGRFFSKIKKFMISHRLAVSLFLLASGTSVTNIANAAAEACYAGICLGDTLKSSKVTWVDPEPFQKVRDDYVKKVWSDTFKETFPEISNSDLKKLTRFLHGEGGLIYKGTLDTLSKVNKICQAVEFTGKFKSKSGHDVEVVYWAMPRDNKVQLEVVSIVVRYGWLNDPEEKQLLSSLRDKYKDISTKWDRLKTSTPFYYDDGSFTIAEPIFEGTLAKKKDINNRISALDSCKAHNSISIE